MSARAQTQRDLLIGLFALQTGMIDQSALVIGFLAWTQDRGRPMGEILVAHGAIDLDQRLLLESLADQHLKKHGGDPEKSLAAIAISPSTIRRLAAIADTELDDSLATMAVAPTETQPYEARNGVPRSPKSGGQRFRVLRPLAQGGLGAVYVAIDAELNREVALKEILERHADNPAYQSKFLIEAEITGGLEHPGIVPVYGLGQHDDGRPYYAMRFIRGDNLKQAIDRFHSDEALKADPGARSLALRELLRRFTDVCNAIEYAHSRGVLHRDIKPGNVIIGKFGETLVVDWGLAKVRGRSDPDSADGERCLRLSSASGSAETLPGQAMGTPAFMSPEQASGDLEIVGPATDVYSLGATLYSLLTGQAPFQGPVLEVLQDVIDGRFPEPRAIDSRIDQALQAVCLKAMAKSPGDRYATPWGLAEEIDRWSADEPVLAWREPWSVRLRRGLVRHKTLAAGFAAAAVVSLVAVAAVAALERRSNLALAQKNRELSESIAREAHARVRVEENFRIARRAVDEYLTKVSEDRLINVPGLQPLRARLLDSARRFYQEFLDRQGDDPELRLEAARSYLRLGDVADLVESPARALALFEKGRDMLEALGKAPANAPETTSDLIKANGHIGSILARLGRHEEAVASYKAALASHERRVAIDPGRVDARRGVTRQLRNLGLCESDRGRLEDALAYQRKALALSKKLALEHPEDLDVRSDEAESHWSIGVILHLKDRLPDAIDSLTRTCGLFRTIVAGRPDDSEFREKLATSLASLGGFLRMIDRNEEAERNLREAVETYSRVVADNPRVISLRAELAACCNTFGDVLRSEGKGEESLSMARRALELEGRLIEEAPEVSYYRQSAAKSLSNIARVEAARGRRDEALNALLRAVGYLESIPKRGPSDEYNLACYLALAAPLIGQSHDPKGQEDLALRAMNSLRRTIASGFSAVGVFRRDSDLEALHGRPDFESLMADLAFPAHPFAP